MLDISTLQAELHEAIDGFVDEVAAALNQAQKAAERGAKPAPASARKPGRPAAPQAPRQPAKVGRPRRKPEARPAPLVSDTARDATDQTTTEGKELGPQSGTVSPPTTVIKRSLLNRPNVVLVPSGSRPVLPAEPAIGEQHDDSAFDEEQHEDVLADRAAGVLVHNVSPLTLEQVRLRLRAKREPLERVMDRLVREGRARAHEEEGVMLYKPPRIEPIRRRRSAGF